MPYYRFNLVLENRF